jgi:starch-binding outer membrane protein, SusD/RagB family
MKKITLPFLLIIVTACVDLVEEPVQQLQSTYFKDLNALRFAVNGSYRQLISDNWEKSVQVASFRVPLMGADDFTTIAGGNKANWREFDQFAASSGNARLLNVTWDMLYRVIRQTTWNIEGAKSLEGKEDQIKINAIVAEAYFLRGWSYFWLVRVFGGLPIINFTKFDESIYSLKRSSVEDVYKLILADLEFAAAHLPSQQPAYGYINKWAAKSYLAEVHLTMAGWPLKQVSHYADAAAYAKDVLDNSPYALQADYSSIFLMSNEANSELIWTIPLCPVGDCGNGFTGSFMAKATKPSELQGWEDMIIELSFFERFPEGVRKDFSILSELMVQSTNPADPFYTRADGTQVHYRYIPYTSFSAGHPFLKKFWDAFYNPNVVANDPMQITDSQSSLDLPMLRLANVQLIYAEAQARATGTPSAQAYEYLNQIRRRGKGYSLNAVGSDVDIASGSLSTDEFVRAVVDEKGWELLGELTRWFDLTRTERVEEVNALRSPNEVLKIINPITKNHYYAPIPAAERLLNPNLDQNPGYE